MEIVYSLGGEPYKAKNDRLWRRDGEYVGRIVNGMVFSPSGQYLGEFRNERLGFKQSHSSKHKGSHMARMNLSGTMRGHRMGRVIPAGWEDFHG